MAAIRLGCDTATQPWAGSMSLSSMRYCGSCVVLPLPVAPSTTQTRDDRTQSTISRRICAIGSDEGGQAIEEICEM
jgi:hypothetical protein